MKIYLRDRNQPLIDAWKIFFRGEPDVEISCGDIFDVEADAIVSPANSFGFMNGGIDAAYTARFGQQLQDRLQERLVKYHYGELMVGEALMLPIHEPTVNDPIDAYAQLNPNEKFKYLISAPTMRIPQPVMHTVHAFLAFRAVLIVAKRASERVEESIGDIRYRLPTVNSILCPGLGTSIGKMPYMSCAFQMAEAYRVVMKNQPLQFEDLADAYTHHASMRQGVGHVERPTSVSFDKEKNAESDS